MIPQNSFHLCIEFPRFDVTLEVKKKPLYYEQSLSVHIFIHKTNSQPLKFFRLFL